MEDFIYADYEYEDPNQEVEYADYYEDDSIQIPDDNWDGEGSHFEKDTAAKLMTLDELYRFCVIPTLTDSYRHLIMILSFSMLFLISSRLIRLPSFVVHLSSTLFGLTLVWQMFQWRCHFMGILFIITYFSLCLFHYIIKKGRGPAILVTGITYLIVCELWAVDPLWWHAIRGIQMVILMKMVSIGYDLDGDHLKNFPNIMEVIGYVANPGSIIFGPWISFHTYSTVLTPMKWNVKWIFQIALRCVASLVFLIISTCFINWTIPDNSHRWLVAYRDALSFRSSHYFVSYLSEVSSSLAGIDIGSVSKPYFMELPRSLVEVVIYWNMPMHHWLKTYVFKTTRIKFGVFGALLLTYGISAMFHGLNFQLAAVLLSLGFYTYTEHTLRQKLAILFDACILARPCSDCRHSKKGTSSFCRSMNLLFGLITMFHLTYLGMMFDSSHQMQEKGYSMIHTLRKWGSFNFISHWLSFTFYIIMSVL